MRTPTPDSKGPKDAIERAPSFRPGTLTGAAYELDSTEPNAARVYNVLLGGDANFEADRRAAEQATEVYPGGFQAAQAAVQANREFLARVVRYLAEEAGVRQFLDLGTGVPDDTNVHAVAQQAAPESRIVCVDYDPVVLAHAHQLMRSTPEGDASFVLADFRYAERILASANILDFDQPVAVMMIALLHLVYDQDNPYELVARYMEAVPSGSYLVLSHLTNDLIDMSASADRFTDAMVEPLLPRTREEVTRFFDGLELVDPGLVAIDEWHPDTPPQGGVVHFAAAARKP